MNSSLFDAPADADDNRAVVRVLRIAAHTLSALALIAASFGAPEHVHEADDHHPAVTHHHDEFHDHDATSVDEADGAVVWLTSPALHSAKSQLHAPVAALPVGFVIYAGSFASLVTFDVAAPAHGPPGSTASSRASPAFSV